MTVLFIIPTKLWLIAITAVCLLVAFLLPKKKHALNVGSKTDEEIEEELELVEEKYYMP